MTDPKPVAQKPEWIATAPTDICLGLFWDRDPDDATFPDDHEGIC
jgi:hypothetical protein